MNETHVQPALREGVESDIVRGIYRFADRDVQAARVKTRLLGSGAVFCEAIAATEMLTQDFQISSTLCTIRSSSLRTSVRGS